ncbi:MAG: hypothetical protein V4672_13020 [Verrucomicrobiota bacterium]
MKVSVAITQIVRSIEVSITQVDGSTTVVMGSRPANVPWSAVTAKPDNLCTFRIDDAQLYVELRDLNGNIITKVPYIPA